MKNLILSALGIKSKDAAPPESALVPAHGDFPAGARVGIVPLGDVTWEILHHMPEKLFSIRHVDDQKAAGPVFQLDEESLADIVVEKGRILHPKKVRELLKGRWVDNLQPGTYFSATDRVANAANLDDATATFDQYVLPYAALIEYLTTAAASLGRNDAPQADTKPIPPPGEHGSPGSAG
jgi:hypothetical protein